MTKFKYKPQPASRKPENEEQPLKEQEYCKMKRNLRIMENDRKAYAQEVNTVLRKQSREIGLLKKENAGMQKSLTVAYDKVHLTLDTQNIQMLKTLVEAQDDYKSFLQLESNACNELTHKLNSLKNQLDNFRRQIGGENTLRERKINTQRKISRLENNANQLTTNLCKKLHENEQTRDKIKLLVEKRKIYGELYDKLTEKISTYKHRIMDVTKGASGHYEARLEAMNKMKTLRERSAKEDTVFLAEMKILQRMIAHDTKLKEFMHIKENERLELKAEEAEKRAKMSIKEKAFNEEQAHVQRFENLFENVRKVTGHDDLEKVVMEFTAKDNENFSRFDYVSELNNDVEKLNEEIQQIKNNIKRVQQEDAEAQIGCEQTITHLQQQKRRLTNELEQENDKLSTANDKINSVCAAVRLLFGKIGCNSDSFKACLAYEDQVSTENIKIYLGLVEQKILELIGMQQFVSLHQDCHGNLLRQPRSTHRIRPRGQSKIFMPVLDKPTLPNIMAPSISDDISSEVLYEECGIPMDTEELRQRAAKKIAKKEAAGLLHQPLFVQAKHKSKPKKK